MKKGWKVVWEDGSVTYHDALTEAVQLSGITVDGEYREDWRAYYNLDFVTPGEAFKLYHKLGNSNE